MRRSTLMVLAGFVLAGGCIAWPAPVAAQTQEWTIDPSHSSVQFSVRHLMVSTVRGRLGKPGGVVRYDGQNPASLVIEATIDVTGIDTQEPKRDAHLRSSDFFDVAKFPTATFKSKRAEAAGAARVRVIGDLTMHGVTREVVLQVEGPSLEVRQGGMRHLGATATATINRSEFGLTWNRAVETGGVVVGDEVTITVDVDVTRKIDTTTAGTK